MKVNELGNGLLNTKDGRHAIDQSVTIGVVSFATMQNNVNVRHLMSNQANIKAVGFFQLQIYLSRKPHLQCQCKSFPYLNSALAFSSSCRPFMVITY